MKMKKADDLNLHPETKHLSARDDYKSYFNNQLQSKKDQEVWALFQKGDEEAFLYIYNQYFYELMDYGIQFSKDIDLLKDCIQDLFINMRRKRESLGKISYSIKAYLFKSLKRSVIKKLTKTKNTPYKDYLKKEEGFEIQLSTETEMINSQLNAEVKTQLKNSINKLPKKQREAILYYYYEGFTYEEITSIMEFSRIEYARITVSNGIKKLRREMVLLKAKLFDIVVMLIAYSVFFNA